MEIIVYIALAVFALYWIVQLFRSIAAKRKLLKIFADGNVIVTGHKGRGKDLLFSWIVNKRDTTALSNVKYSSKTVVVPIKDLNIDPNTYQRFIDGKTEEIEKNPEWEGKDYFLSDGGLYLPSQYQADLVKKYPTLPLFYAVSRHLYEMNVHVNIQNLNRLWDKLREQADYYVDMVKAKRKFWRIFELRCTVYDNYEAAEKRVQPFVVQRGLILKDKTQRALAQQHKATYGNIERLRFWIILPKAHYDTRHFHKQLFGVSAPPKRGKKKEIGKTLDPPDRPQES